MGDAGSTGEHRYFGVGHLSVLFASSSHSRERQWCEAITKSLQASIRKPEPLLLLAGPTAVGKSALALLLAERSQGEIVAVDSMQVYRGLEIGTAKPSAEERRQVPHHLIDVVELTQPFDAAQFVRRAHEAIESIRSRRHLPILCGGTGLYFKGFLEGLGSAPASDPVLRAELEAAPVDELLRELAERDPVTYATIDRENPRRVVRAVEVLRLTGRPFCEQRADWSSPKSKVQSPRSEGSAAQEGWPGQTLFVLRRSMPDLRHRINLRVEAMFRDGLVAETQELLGRGLRQNRAAMQALGYRQVVEHLEGKRSLAETIELVKTKTRQFAKRQMTWFRQQPNVTWIDVSLEDSTERVAQLFLTHHVTYITAVSSRPS
jgi:tRNA dimethylallyltransferase